MIDTKALLAEFSSHLEQMSNDDVRAFIQRAERLTATEFELDIESAERIEKVVRCYPLSLRYCAEYIEVIAPLAELMGADGAYKFLQEVVESKKQQFYR